MTKIAAVFSLSVGKLKKTDYPDISEHYIRLTDRAHFLFEFSFLSS